MSSSDTYRFTPRLLSTTKHLGAILHDPSLPLLRANRPYSWLSRELLRSARRQPGRTRARVIAESHPGHPLGRPSQLALVVQFHRQLVAAFLGRKGEDEGERLGVPYLDGPHRIVPS
jgi:hypothetical protein